MTNTPCDVTSQQNVMPNEFCGNLIFMEIWYLSAIKFCKYIKQVPFLIFIVKQICSPFLSLSDMLQSLCDFPVTWKCKYFLTYIWLSSVIFMFEVVNIPLLITRYYFSSIWSFVHVLHINLEEKTHLTPYWIADDNFLPAEFSKLHKQASDVKAKVAIKFRPPFYFVLLLFGVPKYILSEDDFYHI